MQHTQRQTQRAKTDKIRNQKGNKKIWVCENGNVYFEVDRGYYWGIELPKFIVKTPLPWLIIKIFKPKSIRTKYQAWRYAKAADTAGKYKKSTYLCRCFFNGRIDTMATSVQITIIICLTLIILSFNRDKP